MRRHTVTSPILSLLADQQLVYMMEGRSNGFTDAVSEGYFWVPRSCTGRHFGHWLKWHNRMMFGGRIRHPAGHINAKISALYSPFIRNPICTRHSGHATETPRISHQIMPAFCCDPHQTQHQRHNRTDVRKPDKFREALTENIFLKQNKTTTN